MRVYHQSVGVFRKRVPCFVSTNHLYANARNNALAPPSFALKGRDLRFEHLTLYEVVQPLIFAAGPLLGRFNPSPQNRFLIGT